jgi:glycosyltransferase involved in cell wall biosynthesis
MKDPEISVLMSAYNAEKTVGESVRSILAQTYAGFELIIVNDGSTDGTREVIRSINDTRIVFIDNASNIGLTRSLIKGVGVAAGKYIARQDADDISFAARLEKQVAEFNACPDLGLLGTWYREEDASSGRGWDVKADKSLGALRWALMFRNPFCHTSCMFRKEAYEKTGGYDPRYIGCEDYDLWSKISRDWPVAIYPEILCKRRITKGSISLTGDAVLREKLEAEISSRNIENAAPGILRPEERRELFCFLKSGDIGPGAGAGRVVYNAVKLAREFSERVGRGGDKNGVWRACARNMLYSSPGFFKDPAMNLRILFYALSMAPGATFGEFVRKAINKREGEL